MAKPEQGINYQDTTGEGNENKPHGISIGEGSKPITNTLQTIGDLMDHNQSVTEDDLANLEATLSNTKIDVGGGAMMTPEEAKNFPDLEHNAKIWEEMSQGNFEHTHLLTRITPEISRHLLDRKGGIDLTSLTSAEGLILPENVGGNLFLNDLTSAEGLILPQTVGGYLELSSLTTAKGLTLPQTVEGNIYLDNLPPSEIEKLKQQRPDLANKIK